MAITKENFTKLRRQGLSVETIANFERGIVPPRRADTQGNPFNERQFVTPQEQQRATEEGKDTSKTEAGRKFLTNVIGGGALAEGLGKAIAAPRLQRQLSEAEQQASDIDLSLIKRINEKKAQGEDTVRLENARNQLLEDMKETRDVQTDFIESLPSNTEVIGSAMRLGATLVAPTIGSTAVKATALGRGVTGVGSGILRGAGAGAVGGGIEGAMQGVGIGVEQGKDAAGVALSGVTGGLAGAAAGGVVGGVVGGIAGHGATKQDFADEFVLSKPKPKVKEEALRSGNFEDPGVFKAAKITPSGRDKKLADSVRDVVSPKAKLSENLNAIKNKVNKTNNGVVSYVKANKVPFNKNQVRSELRRGKDELELVFASETNAEKTYDKLIDVFVEQLDEGDTAGLLRARQDFDGLPAVKKLLDTDITGENARKEIVLTIRRKANEYIASLLPEGNTFRADLLQEHYMLEALGNAAESNAGIIGKNKIQLLNEKYPLLKWIVGAGILGGGVGAGGTLIGSTD